MSWSAARVALDQYEESGVAALKPDASGKKPGSSRNLSAEQEQAKIICGKRLEQLKMDSSCGTVPQSKN